MHSYNPFSPLASADLVNDSFDDRMGLAFDVFIGTASRVGIFDYLTLGLGKISQRADNFLWHYRIPKNPPLTRALAYLGSVITYPLSWFFWIVKPILCFIGALALSPIIATVYLATLPTSLHRRLDTSHNPSFANRIAVANRFFTGAQDYSGVFDFLTLGIGRLMTKANHFLGQYRAQNNPPFTRALAYLGSVVIFPASWILMGARIAVGYVGILAVSPVVAVVHVGAKAINWVRAKMSGHEENAFYSDSNDKFSPASKQERQVDTRERRSLENYNTVAGMYERTNNKQKEPDQTTSTTHEPITPK